MDIHELNVFMHTAQEGTISGAAQKLHCVQSNVTARIKHLEEQLGTPLFYRTSKGVVLTSAGDLLRQYAERILALVAEAEHALTDHHHPRGKLNIGSMETTAAVRLPPLLSTYHQRYPEVELNLTTGPSEYAVQQLLEFKIDCAFVAGDIDHPELDTVHAFEEELVLITPAEITEFKQISSPNILVFRSGCSYRARLESWLRAEGRIPYRIMEFGSIEGIMGCVAAGMGVSFLPRSVTRRLQHHNCSLLTLPEEVAHITTWLATRRDKQFSPAMQAFLNTLGEDLNCLSKQDSEGFCGSARRIEEA
jgi:DNA-binding transcriptional LysR family regulator